MKSNFLMLLLLVLLSAFVLEPNYAVSIDTTKCVGIGCIEKRHSHEISLFQQDPNFQFFKRDIQCANCSESNQLNFGETRSAASNKTLDLIKKIDSKSKV